MKKFIAIFLLSSFAFCTNLFAQVDDPTYGVMLNTLLSHTVKEVSVKEASAQQTSAIFLDTREEEEYKVSHLKDARYVGYNEFDLKMVKGVPKDQSIIVYCAVGYRSEKVAEKLVRAGYKNVSNLYGGIFEWVNQGNPVYDPSGKPTNKVHAYNSNWGVWLTKGEKVY